MRVGIKGTETRILDAIGNVDDQVCAGVNLGTLQTAFRKEGEIRKSVILTGLQCK